MSRHLCRWCWQWKFRDASTDRTGAGIVKRLTAAQNQRVWFQNTIITRLHTQKVLSHARPGQRATASRVDACPPLLNRCMAMNTGSSRIARKLGRGVGGPPHRLRKCAGLSQGTAPATASWRSCCNYRLAESRLIGWTRGPAPSTTELQRVVMRSFLAVHYQYLYLPPACRGIGQPRDAQRHGVLLCA